jgi:hypothetical protein
VATRIHPVPKAPQPTVEEIVTHVAVCPYCAKDTRVSLDESATVSGSCVHFDGIEQRADRVLVIFSLKVE